MQINQFSTTVRRRRVDSIGSDSQSSRSIRTLSCLFYIYITVYRLKASNLRVALTPSSIIFSLFIIMQKIAASALCGLPPPPLLDRRQQRAPFAHRFSLRHTSVKFTPHTELGRMSPYRRRHIYDGIYLIRYLCIRTRQIAFGA